MSDYKAFDRSTYLDLAELLRVLTERKWVIVVPAVLALGVALYFSLQMTPKYEATAKVLLQNTSLDNALFGAQVFEVTDQQRALTTAAGMVTLDSVAQRVKEELGTRRPVESLQQMVTVATAPAADVLSISAVSTSPTEAADIANAFARQFIAYRRDSDRATLRQAAAQVQAQLDAMTPQEQSSARGLTLAQKVEELAVLESMQTGGFELIQEAVPPKAPFAPRTTLYAGVAGVLGLIVGLVAAFLLHVFDRRVKDEDVVQREMGVSVIASIPIKRHRRFTDGRSRAYGVVGFRDPNSSMLEAFRTLRSNLKFFQIDRELKTILVTSPLPSEGKSTTAANLALALALSGSRVILLEADLRRPKLHQYLGLDSKIGFSNLLAGTHSLTEVAQAVDVNQWVPNPNGKARPRPGGVSPVQGLLFIPAGPLPPNPAELLAMDRTSEVLREAGSLCDFLIVDAPPVLLVSDALELAKKVDGTIVVTRLFVTKIEEIRHAQKNLRQVGVQPLGAVVLGPAKAKTYYRQYGGYYVAT